MHFFPFISDLSWGSFRAHFEVFLELGDLGIVERSLTRVINMNFTVSRLS